MIFVNYEKCQFYQMLILWLIDKTPFHAFVLFVAANRDV